MQELKSSTLETISGAGPRGSYLELNVGLLAMLAAEGVAVTGAGAAATVVAAPTMVVVGSAALAAGGGFLIGDFIETRTGIGKACGEWVGSTWIGSHIFNW